MKKMVILAATAACASVMMAGCGSSKPASITQVTNEQEVVMPCAGLDSDEGFLRVSANGKSKDRAMAKDRAYQAALANLAPKLAGVISMGSQRVGVSTEADGEEFHDKVVAVSRLIAQANVSGYRTACEKYTINKKDGANTCYVTIEFGKQQLVKQLYESLSNDKLLKAEYDFSKYMKEFDADLKEYEKNNK
jgi:hypothetical protein